MTISADRYLPREEALSQERELNRERFQQLFLKELKANVNQQLEEDLQRDRKLFKSQKTEVDPVTKQRVAEAEVAIQGFELVDALDKPRIEHSFGLRHIERKDDKEIRYRDFHVRDSERIYNQLASKDLEGAKAFMLDALKKKAVIVEAEIAYKKELLAVGERFASDDELRESFWLTEEKNDERMHEEQNALKRLQVFLDLLNQEISALT